MGSELTDACNAVEDAGDVGDAGVAIPGEYDWGDWGRSTGGCSDASAEVGERGAAAIDGAAIEGPMIAFFSIPKMDLRAACDAAGFAWLSSSPIGDSGVPGEGDGDGDPAELDSIDWEEKGGMEVGGVRDAGRLGVGSECDEGGEGVRDSISDSSGDGAVSWLFRLLAVYELVFSA